MMSRNKVMTPYLTAVVILALCMPAPNSAQASDYVQWIQMSNSTVLPETDDGSEGPIQIPIPGFPFWDTVQTQVFIGTNGLISFGTAYNPWSNQQFSSSNTRYLVAPFWDDVDIRDGNGNISYQTYTSGAEIRMVNDYIQQTQNYTMFDGTWMMVVYWNEVHRYFGASNSEDNTFQAVLITDGVKSFAIFTYYCGLIEWDNGGTTTIGFNAGGQVFRNEDPTGIALSCVNGNVSRWSNVVYNLSMETNIPLEPDQDVTVDYISIDAPDGTILGCLDCNTMITLPQPFPFGEYNHTTAYINANGVVSMSYMFPNDDPSAFPTTSTSTYWPYSVAPFWSKADLRVEGMIKWKFYNQSDREINWVNSVIESDQQLTFYSGSWMLVVHWDMIHPFPHGDDPTSLYNMRTNSYQAILTTDGTKSYVVFTYKCSNMSWAVTPTIGYNAGGTDWVNHYLTGLNYAYLIGCVHGDNKTNNIVYDLVPDPDAVLNSQANPPYHETIGSCRAANYTMCCTSGSCLGEPQLCYCDANCYELDSCCYDAFDICPPDLLNDDYLIVAERESLDHIAFNGTGFVMIRNFIDGDAIGLDYHFQRNDVFWSDTNSDAIYRAKLDGTGLTYTIVNSYISAVDDVAVDWVANNIYWVDAIWARIEVSDVEGTYRAEILRTGPNTNPRGIAVDPLRRYMYWTNWGRNATIERADMDGENRMTIIGSGLLQPFGITVDYDALRIYWCDSQYNVIEYAGLSGTGRTVLVQDISGLAGLFSLTISGTLLFWTDQDTNAIYATHKVNGLLPESNATVIYRNFQNMVHGIEAVSSTRQDNSITNACEISNCPQLCLLSTGSSGYTCKNASDPSSSAPEQGSCAAAQYQECCTHGYCAGSPATCFCDSNCYDRGDCCMDVNVTCFAVPPRTPLDVMVVSVTETTATISWRIPRVLYTQEEYYVRYGITNSVLGQRSDSQFSDSVNNENVTYNVTINNLRPDYSYYFLVTSENSIAPKNTEITSFTTQEAAPYGPPLNFSLTVTDNTVLNIYWEPPAEDLQNGDIVSYMLNCFSNQRSLSYSFSTPQNISIGVYRVNEEFACSISASTAAGVGPAAIQMISLPDYGDGPAYFPFIPLDILSSSERGQLSEVDDDTTGPIPLLSSGVPFGSSNQTIAYVGSNGLISFGTSFNSFINRDFSAGDTFYAVAPFWDDIDLRGESGDIYYQTFTSGAFLDQVNDYITRVRPTSFQATWMMVAYYVRVNAHNGFTNTAENTFQAVVASDGTYTYTIFAYRCGLLEWGSSATVGYSAAGNPFFNNGPVTTALACENQPDSDWNNIVHLLSNESPEIPPPSNVQVTGVTNESAIVTWTIPFISQQQTYTVVIYTEDLLNITTTGQVVGLPDPTLMNQTYSFMIIGLSQATTYNVQIFSNFDVYTLNSDIIEFTTRESAPSGAPVNFTGMADGYGIKFTWDPPPGDLLIDSYNLSCMSDDGSDEIQVQLNPILTFTVPELLPSTAYICTILASTTGGPGPRSPIITVTTNSFSVTDDIYLPFLQLDAVYGVEQVITQEGDDSITGPIEIQSTFPFASSSFSFFYIGTNGLLSFNPAYNSFSNRQFPIDTYYLVAPFWDDVDIRGGNGQISYEIHQSGYFLDQVNFFLQRKRPSDFVGTWMAIVYYDAIHPFFGASNPEENTFQAILITDGTYSYTIFTYMCGLMEWDNGATIGYNAAGGQYENNDPSSSDVACLNVPLSNYSNVMYRLSEDNPELEPPRITGVFNTTRTAAIVQFVVPRILTQESYIVEYYSEDGSLLGISDPLPSIDDISVVNATYTIPLNGLSPATVYYFIVVATYDVVYIRSSEVSVFRTLENDQAYYLPFLQVGSGTSIISGTLSPCEDCTTDEIPLPEYFPFGGYFHQQVFVSWNGLISFGRSFEGESPELFPPNDADIFWRYLLAPFWADFDMTTGGLVTYEVHTSNTSSLLSEVNQLIQIEGGDEDFVGTSMLVATWDNIPSPYSDINNTFQGIAITNGSRSYAVYTYNCTTTSWLGPATVGYNAPTDFNTNHPIIDAGLPAQTVACVHETNELNNVIYALEVDDAVLGMTPEPSTSIGSCRAAGYSTCCTDFSACLGEPGDCFCDSFCLTTNDCCYDFADICPDGEDTTTYNILVANGQYIYAVHSTAEDYDIVQDAPGAMHIGLEVDLGNSKMFWSDVFTNVIYRADLDGLNSEPIVTENILLVEDLAYDWVSNKLYWVDGRWSRIEVMDLITTDRAELIRTGPNTSPRAIAVEPTTNKFIFWTDYGMSPMIERAFMDGSDRRTIISSGLAQPSGITVDLFSERIYWTDSNLAKIEYAKFDGTERTTLETANSGIVRPFSVSVVNEILFWSDSRSGSVYATHKVNGTGSGRLFTEVIHFPASTPHGIEVLVSDRQPAGNNTCEGNNCSHICLMTLNNEWGYTCACPYGYDLERDGLECKEVQASGSGSGIMPPPEGSCIEAGYNDSCCTSGYCAGYPAICSCNVFCYDIGDCCSDIDIVCERMRPVVPTSVVVLGVTGNSAFITWVIPYIEYTSEQYTVLYGESADMLDSLSITIPSYSDVTLENQTYTVTLNNLGALTTYFFAVHSENSELSSQTGIMQFTTTEDAPNGPPTNFNIAVQGTTLTFSWELPVEDNRNGAIISFSLMCTENGTTVIYMTLNLVTSITLDLYKPSATYMCSVAASTAVGLGPYSATLSVTTAVSLPPVIVHQFIPAGVLYDSSVTYLQPSDEGTSEAIIPSIRVPFGNSIGSSIYIASNGHLTFDEAYTTYSNGDFPGSVSNRYFLAPFWDDVDTSNGNGDIYYEVHESGHYLNQVNRYINTVRPSNFEGTWMLVATWNAVPPFPGFFTNQANTFQSIVITDGNYTYSVFVYFCGLLEWGNFATIGFNAPGRGFDNYDPSSLDVACLNQPFTDWTNIVYRLSIDSAELSLPEQVMSTNITMTSAIVTWIMPSPYGTITYYLQYGQNINTLNVTSEPITVVSQQNNETYSVVLNGLNSATMYYYKVVVLVGEVYLYSSIDSFTTIAQPPAGPPLNFQVMVEGISLTFTWDAGDNLISYYLLVCNIDENELFRWPLKPITEIKIEELLPLTNYTCSIAAATSGGMGPFSDSLSTITGDRTSLDVYLPYFNLDVTYGVERQQLPESDDGTEGPIEIPPGFPFGYSTQNSFYVGTNGLLSFGTPYNSFNNEQFSESTLTQFYLVAPFWDDIDITGGNGIISYEIHQSGYYLDLVNNFLQINRPSTFEGTWMAIVYWDAVHPWFGASNPEENTFQAVLVTDGNYTYSIFIYKCGLLEWDRGVTIGYSAGGNPFDNFDPSTSAVACLNSAYSNFTNVIYRLSIANPEFSLPMNLGSSNITLTSAIVTWKIPSFMFQEEYYVEYGVDSQALDYVTDSIMSPSNTSITDMIYSLTLTGLTNSTIYAYRVVAVYDIYRRYSEVAYLRTREPEQTVYLPFIDPSDSRIDGGMLQNCDDCSTDEISLENFPFGGYYHQSVYVNSNGLITFGNSLTSSDPVSFPGGSADIFWSYIVAPFWSDIDITTNGSIYWETYSRTQSPALLDRVSNLIQQEYMDSEFNGTWMMVTTWKDVLSPNRTKGTFQAILVTGGYKSYAVFTYRCGYLEWTSPATIGMNAPADSYYNHPLTGTVLVDQIACVHQYSEWNNVIINIEVNPVILPVTPEPSIYIGSCVAAGYDSCCPADCFAVDCYCDNLCFFYQDCCYDYTDICQDPTSVAYDLFVANGDSIMAVHFEGEDVENLRFNTSQTVQGIDFHYSKSLLFFSHSADFSSSIHMIMDLTGNNTNGTTDDSTVEIVLVDKDLYVVVDIAVDWIANNLYWVDSAYVRIEVLNIDTMYRAEVLTTGINTNPTAIAVDPLNSLMFWTDYGSTPMIESAFLDGSVRRALHTTGLMQPVGITVDYTDERIYWSDAGMNRIEFSNYDGSGRTVVETEASGLIYPFALTVANSTLFWTDWETNTLYATHKTHGSDANLGGFASIATFSSTPFGLEAILENRQPQGLNSCETANCSHICLLTESNENGYTCVCPEGYILEDTGICRELNDSEVTPPPIGSCYEAGYTSCCTTGYCAGTPPTCFCRPECTLTGSCCSDFESLCQEAPPVMPVSLMATYVNRTRADVTWVVPSFAYGTEVYYVEYGLQSDSLDMVSGVVFSGQDAARVNQQYTVTLTDLQPFTLYYYRVSALNILSNVTYSEVSSFMTINLGPPTKFEIIYIEAESLTFSWNPPYDSKDVTIDSYTITCNPTFQEDITMTVPSTLTTMVIEDKFIPGTNYTCSVYATNNLGDGLRAEQSATTLEIDGYLPFLVLGDGRMNLPNVDDAASESIDIPGGLSTDDVVHTRAFVTTNGFISLDNSLLFWDASAFPTNEYYINTGFIFAPFWSDIDIGTTGSVSYEVYTRGNSDRDDAILYRVNRYISTTVTEFSGNWMLLAQWDRVPPFPNSQGADGLSDDYMDFLEQRNTFQAIIISDGINTHAIYTYNCNLMSWSGYNSYATIGYNLNGTFFNHFLSNTELAYTVACSSVPNTTWHNLVYSFVGMNENQAARSTCLASVYEDEATFGPADDIFNNLEPCPCSLSQAEVDFRFGVYLSTEEIECYVQLVPYGTAVQSCCYSNSGDTAGALLTSGADRGSMLQYSPFFYPNMSLAYDYTLKEQCCRAQLCDFYFSRRPADSCTNYQAPFFGWGFGDPHFRTLDGVTYTFNGQGEYTLLRVEESRFMLQGRMEPVVGSGGYQATRFTAFAFGIAPLLVEVRVERGRIVVLQNGGDITAALSTEPLLQSDAVFVLTDDNNFVGVFYSGQVAHVVAITRIPDIEYLTYSFSLKNTMSLTTSGLLGTFNLNISDDFTYPSGAVIPFDSSDQMIHEWGQAWQVTAESSWFTYDLNESVDTYSNPDFVPSFSSDVLANASDSMRSFCSENMECIFDYVVTGSQDVASATRTSSDQYMTQMMKAILFPPIIISANGYFMINIGQPSTLDLTVINGELGILGDPIVNSMLEADSNTSGLYHLTWTLSEMYADPITFIANSSEGLVSTFSPYLLLCGCENGGVCTEDGYLGSPNNVIVLKCNCPEAWTGDFCTEDLNECSQIHCFEGSQCSDISAPGAGHVCEPCPMGFLQELEKCADIDECSRQDTNNCQHGCINTFGSYECTCISGYMQDPNDRTTCIDVDECADLTSNCEQICINTEGSYTCDCNPGFSLNSNGSCTVLSMCPSTNNCSDICSLVGGVPQCSCPRGYELIGDTDCQDINECDAMLCEQVCNNTLGSFICSCGTGYTLGDDGRSCNDIDECISGQVCPPGQLCMNTPGNYSCNCPEGTMLNEAGMCENTPPVEPTKVVILPTTSIMTEETATPSIPLMPMSSTPMQPVVIVTPTPDVTYFLTVTLPDFTAVTFTSDTQLQFRKVVAEIITQCCINSTTDDCQVTKLKREVVSIDEKNVFITNIKNGSDGKSVQFMLYISTSSDGSSVLNPESIAKCLMNAEDQLKAGGFNGITYEYNTADTSKQEGSGGLSGGAIAGIVIAIIFVVVAVGATAAFILYRWRRHGKYTVNEIFTEKMSEFSMPTKEDLAALVESESEGKL